MRRIATAALVLLPFIAALPACGGSSGSTAAPRRDTRALSEFEIQEARSQGVASLYQLVATRKPNWLSTARSLTTGRTAQVVTVWMDGVRLGGPDQLRTIPLSVVVAVRYLTPSEAQAALGLDNLGGAIVVTSQR